MKSKLNLAHQKWMLGACSHDAIDYIRVSERNESLYLSQQEKAAPGAGLRAVILRWIIE